MHKGTTEKLALFDDKKTGRFGGRFPIKLYVVTAIIGFIGAIFLIIISHGNVRSKVYEYATIEIADSVSGRVYGKRLIKNNDQFSIEFIHSVNNSLVQEFFRVEGKEIHSEKVRFHSFGAGMLSDMEEGIIMNQEDDAMVISGFNRSFSELNYIVGTVSDHILVINKERISLRDLCGRNSHVSLYISRGANK